VTEKESSEPEAAAEKQPAEEAEAVSVESSTTEPTETKQEELKQSSFDKEKILPEIPNHAQYLIVGGGTAAMSAFKAIRAQDPTARVLVITEEQYKPYMRPPLSKELWSTEDQELLKQLKFKQYNGNERSLFFLDDEFYIEPKYLNENENGGVAVATSKRVTQVDIQNKTVRLDNNWEISYDKCLIATGGRPRNLPTFVQQWDKLQSKVTLFRNIEDFKRLNEIARQGKSIAIIGGGFLGSELACALASVSKKHGGSVVQLMPESGVLRRVLPDYLSQWTTNKVKEEGVSVVSKVIVSKATLNDDKVELQLESTVKNEPLRSNWLLADHVVVAVGLEPNVQLAKNSGFEIDPNLGGYVVNAELQARNSIWVAGDAACFYDVKLGRRRVEHHDHAVVSGRLAGENMTGASKPYWHQSMFWSDLGPNVGFEAIGLVDSSLQTVGLFAKADESDTPQAQVSETNETLRSEAQNGADVILFFFDFVSF
jgi:programmed cell death 8 (apoptosis-inducing factor)